MDRIMSLRAEGITQQVSSTCGSRHAEAFADIIEKKGILDEPMLAIRTFGFQSWRRLIGMIPIAIQSFRHQKVPPSGPLHRPIPGIDQIRRFFKHMRNKS